MVRLGVRDGMAMGCGAWDFPPTYGGNQVPIGRGNNISEEGLPFRGPFRAREANGAVCARCGHSTPHRPHAMPPHSVTPCPPFPRSHDGHYRAPPGGALHCDSFGARLLHRTARRPASHGGRHCPPPLSSRAAVRAAGTGRRLRPTARPTAALGHSRGACPPHPRPRTPRPTHTDRPVSTTGPSAPRAPRSEWPCRPVGPRARAPRSRRAIGADPEWPFQHRLPHFRAEAVVRGAHRPVAAHVRVARCAATDHPIRQRRAPGADWA